MRSIVIKLILFLAIFEGLHYVDLTVLLTGAGVAMALIVCADLLMISPTPR